MSFIGWCFGWFPLGEVPHSRRPSRGNVQGATTQMVGEGGEVLRKRRIGEGVMNVGDVAQQHNGVPGSEL